MQTIQFKQCNDCKHIKDFCYHSSIKSLMPVKTAVIARRSLEQFNIVLKHRVQEIKCQPPKDRPDSSTLYKQLYISLLMKYLP